MLFAALENVTLMEEGTKLCLTFPDMGGREMRDMVKDGLGDIKESIKKHSGLDIEVVTRLESDFDGTRKPLGDNDPLEDIINLIKPERMF